jgi:SpoVK/Ycf46/Vps4 family AAA+-type ATPase
VFASAVRDHVHNLIAYVDLEDLTAHSIQTNPVVLRLLKRRVQFAEDDAFLKAIRRYQARATPRAVSPPQEPFASNLRQFGEMLELSTTELEVLRLAFAIVDSWHLREIVTCLGRASNGVFARLVAAAVARPLLEVTSALSPASKLTRCGLLDLQRSGDMEDRLVPKLGLQEVLEAPSFDRAGLFARFLPEASGRELAWLDHEHLAEEIGIARELLASALRSRARGVNVLFYGETGTGKTELARTLARGLGVPLYAAQRDDELEARHRLGTLMLGLALIEPGQGLLLFDELEDVFERGAMTALLGQIGSVISKEAFNRLLEDNPTPVIWTSNHVRYVDHAFLRRFSFAIEVTAGGVRQRARVLKHHLERPVEAADAELDRLAARFEASPAQISAAVRAARLLGEPATERVATLLAGTCRLLGGRPARDAEGWTAPYCVDAINASVDVEELASRLVGWKPGAGPGVTMCLYGPPGTGKTEYVRYLASRLGRRVVVKRASDLLSPFVGQTEMKIAHAFEQASVEDELLVFDEVDSLLGDRRAAFHGWEVTQVNEMLQQLERFEGLVACTTNLWDRLDAAVLRRFVFKIELRPPTPAQLARLFLVMFDGVLDPSEDAAASARRGLASLRATPGDLATVRRRLIALRRRASVEEVLDEIRGEVGARASRRTGFSANAS